MPYLNEHAARQYDPGKYSSLRRENDKFGPGIDVIWGVLDNGKTEVQAIRFDAMKFTPDQARKWLEEHEYKTGVEVASKTEASFQLDKSLEFQSISAVKQVDGIPSRKYRKEVIRTGTYVNDDQEFEITAITLDNWVKQFRRMKRAGVKVPIPLSHSDNENSEKNRGWVTDLFIEGQSLFMTCELIGNDAIETAARADVSLFSPPVFQDGKGNEYIRPITHIAMTTHPVVPGLDEFVPLAASLKYKENKMDLTKLKSALKLDLDEDKAEDQITAAFSQLKTGFENEEKKRKTAEKERDEFKKKMEEDGKGVPEPDNTLISLAADNRKMKLTQLVEAARITPAVRDKLTDLFLGDENKALVLSLKAGTQDQFDQLVLALSENDPVKLKEQSGSQTLELSDSKKKSGDPSSLVADAERRAKEVVV